MLTLRKRVLLIIGGIVLVVAGILLGTFFWKKSTPTETLPTGQNPAELPPIGDVQFKQPENLVPEQTTPPVSPDETYAKQTARIFVERFWSYSNQNDNQHIEDALALSSDSMRTWISSQSGEQSAVYQGVTTEVLSSRILSYSPQQVSVEIEARQTTRGTGSDGIVAEETKNITAKVDLVKVGDKWLVEGLWKE